MGSIFNQLGDDVKLCETLSNLGFLDSKRAAFNLQEIARIASASVHRDSWGERISSVIPTLSDPDRAINNLERLFSGSKILVETLASQSDESQSALLVLLATSQYLSDLLIRDSRVRPEMWQQVWSNRSQPFSQSKLTEDLVCAIDNSSLTEAMQTLRQFKQQQMFRIGIDDLFSEQRIEQVTAQISQVATSIVEASYRWARRELVERFGEPKNGRGEESRFVVLAMGKLGGAELNYSSDIDLVMLFDESESPTSGQRISNQEFYERLCRRMLKLIGETTELGSAYRVDLRLRPNGASGKVCNSYAAMIRYYDLQGRTWERQALIKAAPIAGDLELGNRLLAELSPWIYRKNLSRADISGVKALKRKIERRALESGEDKTNVKTGHGGIRDVEFIIQFLQLLNGGDLPQVRTTNTLDAIRRLEKEKCLSPAESTVLSQNYSWLRKLEHRLQMMFDLQTHSLPTEIGGRSKLAKRMGFFDRPGQTALEQFQRALYEATQSNRRILDHLLHGAFGMAFGSLRDTGGTEYRYSQDEVPLEVDLILDPDPDSAMVENVLRPYGFQNVVTAHRHLMELAKEPTRFLSSRRCKHFLASVAPALLAELAQTPDPDASLVTLATVSDCLGAKGVLWELFSFNPPTLSLYVRICASSDYLVGILKSNPGMIDELVDALQLDGLPSCPWLESNMEELARGATDLSPIVHSFKNTQHVRVGIRDILGRDDVRNTHIALADVAEICLRTAANNQYATLLSKHASNCPADIECPLVILGLGKLGGREPNYHSDLDVIFLYDSRDEVSFEQFLNEGISSQFFCSELAAAITTFLTRLYEIDSRLRPTGKSGSLAVSMGEFKRYFESGQGQLWERQSLCKARPVFGTTQNATRAMKLVREAITRLPWRTEMADEIHKTRLAMQNGCTPRNLKRGEGGTVDVEFAIQMLQLKYANSDPSVLVPGTLEAIERLVDSGFLPADVGEDFSVGYQLLRSVEARLRLMNTTARHDLPEDKRQLAKLAYLLGFNDANGLLAEVDESRKKIRIRFEELFEAGP